jgi:uncharacterized membrane protein (DUF106 family)
VNRRFGKRSRLKEIQRIVNDYQKDLKHATERKDEKRIKELQARESEMLSLTQEMLVLPFRSMVVVIPLFFGALWVVQGLAPGYSSTLPFSLPVPDLGRFSLDWRSTFGSRGTFILWSIVFGLAIESIVSRREKKRLAAQKVK